MSGMLKNINDINKSKYSNEDDIANYLIKEIEDIVAKKVDNYTSPSYRGEAYHDHGRDSLYKNNQISKRNIHKKPQYESSFNYSLAEDDYYEEDDSYNNYNSNFSNKPNYRDNMKESWRDFSSNRRNISSYVENNDESFLPFNEKSISPEIVNKNQVKAIVKKTLKPALEGWLDENLDYIIEQAIENKLEKKLNKRRI